MSKILIVDDDPDYVEVIQVILENIGHRVSHASNGETAMKMIRQDKPDLIILDIMMKTILDGWNFSKAMREDEEMADIPIIIASSITQSEFAGQFPTDQYLHARDWIDKPVKPEKLIEKLRRHLK